MAASFLSAFSFFLLFFWVIYYARDSSFPFSNSLFRVPQTTTLLRFFFFFFSLCIIEFSSEGRRQEWILLLNEGVWRCVDKVRVLIRALIFNTDGMCRCEQHVNVLFMVYRILEKKKTNCVGGCSLFGPRAYRKYDASLWGQNSPECNASVWAQCSNGL